MQVCLINPPTRSLSLRPPHGLMYISAYLGSKGVANHLIDPKGNDPMEIFINRIVRRLTEISPDFVGISCLTTDVPCVMEMALQIKKNLPHTKIVLGGTHPTLFPEEMLANENIDFVVLGEGEETFFELVNSYGKTELSLIDGIAFKADSKVIVNKRRDMIRLLDSLPLPAFDKVDMDFYLQPNIHLVRGIPLKGFYIFSSRGCPYRCRFCVNKNIFGRTVRFRDPVKVVDEIEYLHKKYKIDAFYLFDDTFAVNKSHAKLFCDEIIKRRLRLVWGCETRVNLLNEEILKKLKKSGCIQIDFGIESGSQRLLDFLQKDITVESVRHTVKLCKKHRMRIFANFMINLPTETEEDLGLTLKLAEELKSDISIFNVTCPFPGTDIQAYLKEKLTMEDYPKMSSMAAYNTYIDFLETKCKLSEHEIPIRDVLKMIQRTVPSPRDIKLKPSLKYFANFFRYFSFLTNLRYWQCMVITSKKNDYLRFMFGALKKRNLSPTKL